MTAATGRKAAVSGTVDVGPGRSVPGLDVAPGIGTVVVAFADLRPGAVDRDGDTYERGAFTGNTGPVPFGPWNHSVNDMGPWNLPIGVGQVTEEGDLAVFRGVLFDTPMARMHLEVLRGLGARAEYSYGFGVTASRRATPRDGTGASRVIQRVNVHEVSPVLRGAGVGTHTVSLGQTDADGDVRAIYDRVQVERIRDQRELQAVAARVRDQT
ncbi:hypothetical protein OWR29_27250 [Actinoplanes sp. Pm04-4]|uniref:HK97 family phage prohead protease n=1 Tax=Paractinoplanes pyxinae TaxID=2997416 RepID=A0ABT4B5D1_9ACTN|nr:hypothetical protein [Actinoplanes pyxinae]MCY1141711.1 hypothetical protein [Actinoplanes pyxinae]